MFVQYLAFSIMTRALLPSDAAVQGHGTQSPPAEHVRSSALCWGLYTSFSFTECRLHHLNPSSPLKPVFTT
ncbi:hypothetical protein BAUCODRAFT_398269 [Baudoinia panamericana UAMH 10762]|uniref:Uncharacterized protein n=1 Tax=Baudoinia panamericana (strain UAMH 10762) TaxID=717646 RepID=M2NIS4_BAUPA|nr:uncharacterized protein BAUCODRAFT_398269 [Baudoinia panamericana UAMH 10762]EMC99294.1 hypothetical protein BAUCODRAFT_398269 [Baudoinia panamericana UAMH 10762]